MPSSSNIQVEQGRRIGPRLVLSITAIVAILGSLMTLWLSPALASQLGFQQDSDSNSVSASAPATPTPTPVAPTAAPTTTTTTSILSAASTSPSVKAAWASVTGPLVHLFPSLAGSSSIFTGNRSALPAVPTTGAPTTGAPTNAPLTTVPPITVPPTTVPPVTVPPVTVPPTTAPPTTAPPTPVGTNSLDRILSSMNSAHEGAPHGVPSDWSWARQPSLGAATPPAGMSALTAWGQIYADSTNTHPANVRVELRNMESYVWSNSNHVWTRVQSAPQVDGAHFVEDFAGNANVPTDLRAEPDGGVSTGMVSGFNFHFWPTSARGSLPNPADVGAVYTTVQARLILDNPAGADNRNQARYLANVGADWWRNTSIGYGDGSNNPGVGQGRFTYVTSNWTAMDFYTGGPLVSAPNSWSESQLRSNTPPINVM